MKVNEDKVLVAEIGEALQRNKELYGARYCPCVPSDFYFAENKNDYVCPCKDFRENVEKGHQCHCGLYIK